MRPSLYYVSKKTGWVGLKKAVFTDVQYCIYADTVSVEVKKVQKYADVI